MLLIDESARRSGEPASLAKRTGVLAFALACYATFLATFLYLVGFLADFRVPRGLNQGATTSTGVASAVDLGLILLFGTQHSVMARFGWKKLMSRLVPAAAERACYVLSTCIVMAPLFLFWQPLPEPVWRAESDVARAFLFAANGLGWALILASTFLIDHFDLFGIRQAWLYFRGKPYSERPFAVPGFYRYVRHPLYVGWIIAFWATPDLTVGRIVFASGMTAYILIAIVFEERDLIRRFGRDYLDYRRRTPMLLPARTTGRDVQRSLEDAAR